MMKRLISMVLVLAMAISLFPASVEADTEAPGVSSDVTLEADTSFGSLLTNTVNTSQQPEEQEEQYEGRICDLVIEGTLAMVEYATPVEANLVVAIYTEDGKKLLGSGVTWVSPEETMADVEIEIPVMPYYFKAGAYLLDARNNDPVSEEFKTDRYTKTMQDILAATVDDFNPALVLNLDGDKTTNFAVFNESTLMAKAGSDQNRITDNGNGSYTIQNPDQRFLTMQPGDTFAYTYADGNVLIVNAASVSVNGTTVTVTENPDAELSTVFDYVKIEEDSFGKDYSFDDSELNPGAVIYEDTYSTWTGKRAARAIDIGDKVSIERTYDLAKLKWGSDNNSLSVQGAVKLGLTFSLKVYVSSNYQSVSFSADFSLSGSISLDGKLSAAPSLGKFDIAICTGVYAHVNPQFVVEASGKLSYQIEYKGSLAQAYDSDLGRWQNISSPPSVKSKAEFTGTLFIGVRVKVGVAVISEKAIDLSVTGKLGFEITATEKIQSLSSSSSSEIHTCALCIEGEIHVKLSADGELKVLNKPVKNKLTIADLKWKLSDFYVSLSEMDSGFTRCPHKAFKTTITVKSNSQDPVKDIPVALYRDGTELTNVILLDEEKNVITGSIPATNEDGQSIFYLPDGQYALQAEHNGQVYTKDFTIRSSSKLLEIKINSDSESDTLILSVTEITLSKVGDSHQLTAMFNGIDVTQTCQWVSSDPKSVTVSNGLVTRVGEGNATISITYTSGGKVYSAQCDVSAAPTVAQGSCGENLTWFLDSEGILTIMGSGRMDNFGDYVNRAPWFRFHNKIKQVTIMEGVNNIGDNAFWYSTSIASISIPDSVTSIGECAFYYCTNLDSITIPSSVTSIGSGAFHGCTSLVSISIPGSVESMGEAAFCYCDSLTSITILDGVTSIGECAFYGCTSLVSISIPNSVTEIAQKAFGNCTSLTSITIPDSVTSIGDRAFCFCTSLASISIPSSVESMGEGAFCDCDSLTSITILDGVTFIADATFQDCSSLISVTIPDSVISIGVYAFCGCINLDSITIPSSVTSIGSGAFRDCDSLTSITILDGVTSIGECAFYGCTSLVSISIPNSVTEIAQKAFGNCTSLVSITIPNSVTSIGEYAFQGCTSLVSISIPNSVISIGEYTFGGCTNLDSVTIPSSVTSIGSGAFHGCTSLVSISIPNSVTSIGSGAFHGCTSLVSISIPNSVISIGEYAFYGCTNLDSITIPSSVKCIDRGSFKNCANLTNVTIPSSVTSIGYDALFCCSSLTNITIPSSVKSIGSSAFYGCNELKEVYYTGTQAQWAVIDIASNNEPLKNATIHYNSGSTPSVPASSDNSASQDQENWKLTGEGVLVISGSGRMADYGDAAAPWDGVREQISAVALEEGITAIGADAFAGFGNLTEVTIPVSMTSIGEGAFADCAKLTDVYYAGSAEAWGQIEIAPQNDALTNAAVHFAIEPTDETAEPEETIEAAEETEPATEPVTEPMTEPTTEPVTEPATEPVTEPVMEPATEPVTEPVTEPITEPVTEPATEPITEPVTEPTAAPAAEPVTEPVAEPAVTSEEAPVADPVSEIQWYIAPDGVRMTVEPVLQRLSAFTGTESTSNGIRSVKFSGLEPGEEYVLIVSKMSGSLVPRNLLYIDQDNAAADGTLRFVYTPREDVAALVQLYGIPANRRITLDREYMIMEAGTAAKKIAAAVTPEEWAEELVWSAENPQGIEVISVDEFGDVTPIAPGTAYAVATVSHGKYTFTARCRVDVTEQKPAIEVSGVQLGTSGVTCELYRRDYAQFDVILLLRQNMAPAMASTQEQAINNTGVAIEAARFEDEEAAEHFQLVVKDDRTLTVVPRQTAMDNPGSVARSYTSRVIVNVGGKEYPTDGSLRLTVRKTMPRLKAIPLTFNAFYTGQSQPILITGATVTGISKNEAKSTALPSWLALSEGVLTLREDAPTKSAYGKAYVLVETQEWAIPAAVTVPLQLTYKAPGVKLAASAVTTYRSSQRLELKLICTNKEDTLAGLNVTGVIPPEGFTVEHLDLSDGSLVLTSEQPITAGKQTIQVTFAGTEKTVSLSFTVNVRNVTLSARPSIVALNSIVGDRAAIALTASTADYPIRDVSLRLTDRIGNEIAPGLLDCTYENGVITVKTVSGKTQSNTTYYLRVKTAEAVRETVITVKTMAEDRTPTVSARAKGSVDLSFPESYAVVTPVFRNYCSGAYETMTWSVAEYNGSTLLGDVTEQFDYSLTDGQHRFGAKGNLTIGSTYQLTINFTLPDGKVYSCSVKLPVSQTAVKLKLSKTSISLNQSTAERQTVAVTCLTKGYNLVQPTWEILLGKAAAQEALDIAFADGKLTVGINGNTQVGQTYSVLLRAAEEHPAATLTVKIPTNTTVTASLRAKGAIDVVRDGSIVTLTPVISGCSGEVMLGGSYTQLPREIILQSSGDDGKTYETVADRLFAITQGQNGSYTISKMPGAEPDTTLRYRAVLTFPGIENSKPAYAAIPVKSGTAKVTVSNAVALYQSDRFSRDTFRLTTTDGSLNPIVRAELANAKYRNLFEIYNYGNGEFAIGFKDNLVPAGQFPTSVVLNVYTSDGALAKRVASVTLKLKIK